MHSVPPSRLLRLIYPLTLQSDKFQCKRNQYSAFLLTHPNHINHQGPIFGLRFIHCYKINQPASSSKSISQYQSECVGDQKREWIEINLCVMIRDTYHRRTLLKHVSLTFLRGSFSLCVQLGSVCWLFRRIAFLFNSFSLIDW